MKRYEVVFISLADLSADETDGVIEKYTSIITALDGKIVKVSKWGKRRLAYYIRKKREGFYTLVDFGGENKIIQELERNFKIDDKILRYQSVKLSDHVDADALDREIEETRQKEAPPAVPPAEEKPEEPAGDAATEPEEPAVEAVTEPEEPVAEAVTEPEKPAAEEAEKPREDTEEPPSEPSEKETGEQ